MTASIHPSGGPLDLASDGARIGSQQMEFGGGGGAEMAGRGKFGRMAERNPNGREDEKGEVQRRTGGRSVGWVSRASQTWTTGHGRGKTGRSDKLNLERKLGVGE